MSRVGLDIYQTALVKGWELWELESGQNIWEFKEKNVKLFLRLYKFFSK